jgi:hypothetical protein
MPGQTATYSLNLAPQTGFNETVTLSCTGAPSLSTCTVSPSSVTLSGTSSSSVTVAIATKAATNGFLLPSYHQFPWKMEHRPTLLLLGLATMALMIASLALWRREGRLRWAPVFSVAVLAVVGMLAVSCGGGSNGSGGGSPGTPAGTYTISISASATTATHTMTVTLVVQ